MSDIVLKVENLYKRYRLGNVDRQAFKEDLVSWWAKLRGKPDPYETYITANDLARAKNVNDIKQRYLWSLQDVNFEIKRGEIVGIIGKNGAGKSTLLKILSKTTSPTKGQVKVKGRIASLLEVGTGFHPELTGRENIYMNGAILGMKRYEIRAKLEQIIAFAGVEAYIDTPVKRYSSGMYVRLAFAVAAHLDPDILIVDEVLAVGDADFQKKCIGKMNEVSRNEGRTVLFVSHNMQTIKQLCNKGILLRNGIKVDEGEINQIVKQYLFFDEEVANSGIIPQEAPRIYDCLPFAKLTKVYITDTEGIKTKNVFYKQKFQVHIECEVTEPFTGCPSVIIGTQDGDFIVYANAEQDGYGYQTFEVGLKHFIFEFHNTLIPNAYTINLALGTNKGATVDWVERVFDFNVSNLTADKQPAFKNNPIGYIKPEGKWLNIH